MRLTIEQAYNSVCPQTLAAGRDVELRCRGDVCMAWRWAEPVRCLRVLARGSDLRAPSTPASWIWRSGDDGEEPGWYEPLDQAQARRRGYCGLAGRPGRDQ